MDEVSSEFALINCEYVVQNQSWQRPIIQECWGLAIRDVNYGRGCRMSRTSSHVSFHDSLHPVDLIRSSLTF